MGAAKSAKLDNMTSKRDKGSKEMAKSRSARPRPLSVAVSREVLAYLRDLGAAHGDLTPDEMAAELLGRHVERKLRQGATRGEPLVAGAFDVDAMFLIPANAESALRSDHLNFQRIAARQRRDNRVARLLTSETDADG